MAIAPILIVDRDLGFVFWLGNVLASGGYPVLAAKDIPDAALLLHQLKSEIGMLIVNPDLEKAAGFILDLQRRQPNLIVIAIADDAHTPVMSGVHASRSKPVHASENARHEWLEVVGKMVTGTGRTRSAPAYVM